MIGPLPPPPADRPELPRVRLDVRAAGGRAVSYEVGSDEFLVGGAGGCDLRLPAANLPPVICQISRKPDGVRARRLTPVLPVLLNGTPLPASPPAPLSPGDVLSMAGVEITVTVHPSAVVLSPAFVPLVEEPPAAAPAPVPPPAPRDPHLQDAELIRRARELDRQTEELEADRVLWYRRRQEMEAEYERHRALLADAEARRTELDARAAELARLGDDLARREEEVRAAEAEVQADAVRRRAEVEAELAGYEPKLRELREHQDRLATGTQELARQRELFAADRDIFDHASRTFEADRAAGAERLAAWEKDLGGREADLARRETEVGEGRAALDRERQQFRDDLVRLERRTAAVEEREQAQAAREREADVRLQQMRRDAGEWEETVRTAAAEGERLRAEADRLDRQKADLDARSAVLAERAGQLESQQAVLAVLRAKLDRTRQDAEREAVQLAAARAREDEALAELRARVREAEELRAELATVQEDTARERRRLDERDSLLTAGLAEIQQQQDALAAEAARLRVLEADLDVRTAEFADQAGTLKGRMTQALDLQARLEADRVAVREREAALAQAEDARQALQEQLRRRAEDLAARAKSLDEVARQVAADRAAAEEARAASAAAHQTDLDDLAGRRRQTEEQAAAVARLAADYADKEQALARQVARLKDVGAAVAAERKALAETRTKWEADRAAAADADRRAGEELAAFHARARAEIDALREQAPELEGQARAALDRLSAARDALRGQLTELHDFARLSREDLSAIRAQVRQEADRLRDQEDGLNRAKAEHRLAVAAFRQQLVDWQGQVAEIRRTVAGSESRLDAREQAVEAAARQADAAAAHLTEEADRLRREREAVTSRRAEVERHLADMREWYRKKLRELAGGSAERRVQSAESQTEEVPRPRLADTGDDGPAVGPSHAPPEELDPGDRQLGDLLRSHALVDADTLAALWAEAGRQRRTLRQVLLASGAVTLYQLALIEAGNLDALVVGRFRVIDRLRVTPREALYRVSDPTAPGAFLLRHLGEGEMHDAVRPDEFRQRFAAARDAAHPNLAGVVEVLEVAGRPAALQEWPAGLFGPDWPAHAAHPGCWARLAAMAAAGVAAAHRHGLAHGRLTPDSFLLTPAGVLKVTGFGEPPWLSASPAPAAEPTFVADLRALGQVLVGWSQPAAGVKKAGKPKPFPEALLAVVRRLGADPEPPMADTVAADRPYESAAELAAELERAAREAPPAGDAWDKLLRHVADTAPDAPAGLKRSA